MVNLNSIETETDLYTYKNTGFSTINWNTSTLSNYIFRSASNSQSLSASVMSLRKLDFSNFDLTNITAFKPIRQVWRLNGTVVRYTTPTDWFNFSFYVTLSSATNLARKKYGFGIQKLAANNWTLFKMTTNNVNGSEFNLTSEFGDTYSYTAIDTTKSAASFDFSVDITVDVYKTLSDATKMDLRFDVTYDTTVYSFVWINIPILASDLNYLRLTDFVYTIPADHGKGWYELKGVTH